MIRLIDGKIIFQTAVGKQFEVTHEKLIEYVDYNKLDDDLNSSYLHFCDFEEYKERNPVMWELILAWQELQYELDGWEEWDYENFIECEVEQEAKVVNLWPHLLKENP